MRKILIFSTAYYPFFGGAEVAVKEITDRVGDARFDMITARVNRKLPKKERIGNVNVYRVGFGLGALDKFFLAIAGSLKALRLNRKNDYDIIWSIMASQASVAASFFKMIFPKAKLVLTMQEGDEEEHLKRYVFGNEFLYKLLIRPWHLLVFKKADAVTAISNYLKARAIKNGVKVPVEIIPNGVDIANFRFKIKDLRFKELRDKLGIKDNEKIVITTSRLVKKNAIDDIVKALQYLPDNIKFLILGTGQEEQNLKSLIFNLKSEQRVIFLGQVNHKDLPAYLKISDVFVRPSLSEGLGNSFLEAMAAGAPVVATPVGGIPDFLRDGKTGWFCEARNPKSIAERIEYILDDKNKEKVREIVAVAKRMVEDKYNWDLIAKKMEEVFIRQIVA